MKKMDLVLKSLIFCILASWGLLFLNLFWTRKQSSPPCEEPCQSYPTYPSLEDIKKLAKNHGDEETTLEEPVTSQGFKNHFMVLLIGRDGWYWEQHFSDWFTENLCPQVPGAKNVFFALEYNKTFIKEADLIIFNLEDLNLEQYDNQVDWISAKLPKQRDDDQIWALFWRESPGKLNISLEKLSWLDDFFHWTISYRRDSDIFYPFGYFKELEQLQDFPTGTFRRKRGCLWNSDECSTSSKREKLVQDMKKLDDFMGSKFKTHVYGACANTTTSVNLKKPLLEACMKKVRFYLALEDEICDDYITDLYFQAMRYGYVPLVFDGSLVGYDEVGIPGTYIDVVDFESSEDLVAYLIHLLKPDNDLVSYLTWSTEYEVLPASLWVCDLKKALLTQTKVKVIQNFAKFWEQKRCYGDYRTL